jgi:hypothetical protein
MAFEFPDLVITHFAKVGKTSPDKSGQQINFNYFQSLFNPFNYQSSTHSLIITIRSEAFTIVFQITGITAIHI